MTYALKDANGGVELSQRGQIVVVVLQGACGTRVINYYAEKLIKLGQTYNGQPWAYLCNGKDFQATTPEAQQTIVGVYNSCLKLGCRYEAYCFNSAVGKAQTQRIMRDCGNLTNIEKVLFDSEQLAEDFLLKKLAKLNHREDQAENIDKNNAS